MREIKFRFWDTFRKVMTYPDDEEKNHRYSIYPDGSFSVEWRGKKPFDEKVRWWCDHSENHERMQFADFRDKNDKEIWEGDIVRDIEANETAEVIWGSPKYPYPGFMLHYFCDGEWAQFEPSSIKVIGNIYEHKHLLEK